MKNIIKFENGKIVFNTDNLRTKQKRNVFRLVSDGKIEGAIQYAAALNSSTKKRRANVYQLADLRQEARSNLPKATTGRIFKLFSEQFNTGHSKGPSKIVKGKAIGVEIEFFMPREGFGHAEACGDCSDCEDDRPEDCENMSAGSLSSARKFFTEQCTKRRIKGINIGEDGSIDTPDDDEWIALEARVLTSIDDTSNLEAFCKLLNEVGAEVNKTCGLHVHLDMRDYERRPATVVKRLARAIPLLKAMVPSSRVDNQYCRHDVGSESNEGRHDSRYAIINDAVAFDKFGTIEVRLHSGSINFTKINNWIRILYSIARTEGSVSAPTLEGFAAHLNWSASLVAYIVTRIRKFNPNHELLGASKELDSGSAMQLTVDATFEGSEAA
jgi:hypothetical protein